MIHKSCTRAKCPLLATLHINTFSYTHITHTYIQNGGPGKIWKDYKHIEAEKKWLPFRRRHLRCIFLNETIWILIKISLNFAPMGKIDKISALVQIMAWHHLCDMQLSESMMVSLLTHICITRPLWVINTLRIWATEIIFWSTLVHMIASRLFDTKPFPEPMVTYCQTQLLLWNKMPAKWLPFYLGLNMLIWQRKV